MNAQIDTTAPRSTTTWWHWGTPPRSGLQRLIAPWEYRHLQGFARARIVSATVLVGLSAVTLIGGSLSPKAAAWAAVFLAGAVAHYSFAAWELAIARRAGGVTG